MLETYQKGNLIPVTYHNVGQILLHCELLCVVLHDKFFPHVFVVFLCLDFILCHFWVLCFKIILATIIHHLLIGMILQLPRVPTYYFLTNNHQPPSSGRNAAKDHLMEIAVPSLYGLSASMDHRITKAFLLFFFWHGNHQ